MIAKLARIAEALDCPVTDFFEVEANAMNETAALLASWHAISDADARREVLSYVRAVAGGASPAAPQDAAL
ncbi:hypothetical protein FV222_19690 [Methylobacterium sp. WL103]|nr:MULTISPECIES: hypothetical protein [Methylobacterium]TXM95881.1 hypothetical protein FV222_19690 [Methylobacterium sp. WL103]TXN02446.1 hypothetical protein FV219_11720 [Methylobacterium sp. WL122]TXN82291.1 hypothetical protein FV234_10420 [Methylobacterium sp. WL8]